MHSGLNRGGVRYSVGMTNEDTHSVKATSEAYWSRGCGADILARTARLEAEEARARTEAAAAGRTDRAAYIDFLRPVA